VTSDVIGRRKFIKQLSSMCAGFMTSRLWNTPFSFAATQKTPSVEYRTLGKTGLKVTAVSMGVMNCSDPAVLLRAFDLGINFYDTADCYMGGRNEEMVGKAFQGKRDKVYLQTKVHAHDEKRMRASVERSLRRLRTDYIDVLVWHGHNSTEEVSDREQFDFMEKMKKEGKIRFSGFSSHSRMAPLLREAAQCGYHDVALVSYNFTRSKELQEAVAMAAQAGVGIVAMKTQAGGYTKEKMEGLTPHQAALKYILRDPHVAAAVPGVTAIEQIEECAAVMGTPVSQRDLRELKAYQAFLDSRICTLCGGCTGECSYGVPYGDLLRAVMYHDGYRNELLAMETVKDSLSRQIWQRCSECPSCTAVCRRGLQIKEQIHFALTLYPPNA
jgi:hypothetical protein